LHADAAHRRYDVILDRTLDVAVKLATMIAIWFDTPGRSQTIVRQTLPFISDLVQRKERPESVQRR